MEPMTVSEVSRLVKDTLQSSPELNDIAVRGEVTNYRERTHHYFDIKDEKSTLRCTVWKSNAGKIGCLPLKNGDRIVAWGSITSYAPQSVYQLNVLRCVPEGRGDLYMQYLELKRRLAEEGLFDPARKKPLPVFPTTVGIVTAEGAAAIQDMFRVFRSGPAVSILTVDSRVQGAGAAESIIRGIRCLDGKADVIIIGRGGGSIEDLWAFNDEALARAVSSCGTPIISAVGHEVDEVITDYAADMRASTPTAAAELVVKGMQQVIDRKARLMEFMESAANERVRNSRQMLDSYDMGFWKKLLLSRIGVSGKATDALAADNHHALQSRMSAARALAASADATLRTTWVAAMAENGLAALYQDGIRLKDASSVRKGKFKGLMRDGKIEGEVNKIEI